MLNAISEIFLKALLNFLASHREGEAALVNFLAGQREGLGALVNFQLI